MAAAVTPSAAHWKRMSWDCYRLLHGVVVQDFKSYEALHAYCVRRNIDARVD